PYAAVIECGPAASTVVVNVATPDPFRVPVPSVVVPSLKVTVPVGVAVVPDGVTVAVNVTDCPNEEGFALDARAVVVAADTPVPLRATDWGESPELSVTCSDPLRSPA